MVANIYFEDFGDPFIPPGGGATAKGSFAPNEVAVESIMNMGFTRDQTCKALKATVSDFQMLTFMIRVLFPYIC